MKMDSKAVAAKAVRVLSTKTGAAAAVGAVAGGWFGAGVGIAALGGAIGGMLPLAALGGGAAYLVTKNMQLRKEAQNARASEQLMKSQLRK